MLVRLCGLLALASLLPLLAAGADQAKVWEEFSGDNALAQTQKLVDFGPRPPGSEAIEKARVYIEAQLKGWGISRNSVSRMWS